MQTSKIEHITFVIDPAMSVGIRGQLGTVKERLESLIPIANIRRGAKYAGTDRYAVHRRTVGPDSDILHLALLAGKSSRWCGLGRKSAPAKAN